MLTASGNEMFEHLHQQVAEVLSGRHAYGLMPHHPHVDALQLHADVAASIQRGDGDRAHEAMVAIMDRTMGETRQLWEIRGRPSRRGLRRPARGRIAHRRTGVGRTATGRVRTRIGPATRG